MQKMNPFEEELCRYAGSLIGEDYVPMSLPNSVLLSTDEEAKEFVRELMLEMDVEAVKSRFFCNFLQEGIST